MLTEQNTFHQHKQQRRLTYEGLFLHCQRTENRRAAKIGPYILPQKLILLSRQTAEKLIMRGPFRGKNMPLS